MSAAIQIACYEYDNSLITRLLNSTYMDPTICISFCGASTFAMITPSQSYTDPEGTFWCSCQDSEPIYQPQIFTKCNSVCPGDATYFCGGVPKYWSMYSTNESMSIATVSQKNKKPLAVSNGNSNDSQAGRPFPDKHNFNLQPNTPEILSSPPSLSDGVGSGNADGGIVTGSVPIANAENESQPPTASLTDFGMQTKAIAIAGCTIGSLLIVGLSYAGFIQYQRHKKLQFDMMTCAPEDDLKVIAYPQ